MLADELRQYVAAVDRQSAHQAHINHDPAARIAWLCQQLLDALPPDPDKRQHRLTQLAGTYFVIAEDACQDNHSLGGFEDDLRVVTAVVHALGLSYMLDE